MHPPLFISFEGIEGSGKSTQIQLWKTHLESLDQQVVCTKEPGGTVIGQAIRQLLLNPSTQLKDPRSELLLFTADRLEHIECVIRPALTQGKTVLCDRYIDSTYAYQLAGRKVDLTLVDALCGLAPLLPSKTILLDLPVEEGLKRAKNRATLDRFEQEGADFHRAVRQGYLAQAIRYPDRFAVIDCANRSPEDVFRLSLSATALPQR